jgi:hypothetical protein
VDACHQCKLTFLEDTLSEAGLITVAMTYSFTSKVDITAHRALAAARRLVHARMDELLSSSNEQLPDVQIIFCPIIFPKDQLVNWPEKIYQNKRKKWISLEKWLPIESFLSDNVIAQTSYTKWIKSSMKEAEVKFPELVVVRQLFDRLPD